MPGINIERLQLHFRGLTPDQVRTGLAGLEREVARQMARLKPGTGPLSPPAGARQLDLGRVSLGPGRDPAAWPRAAAQQLARALASHLPASDRKTPGVKGGQP